MIVRISQATDKNINDINVMRQQSTVLKSSSVLALARGRQANWEYQIACCALARRERTIAAIDSNRRNWNDGD
jgi:hypothetical protein